MAEPDDYKFTPEIFEKALRSLDLAPHQIRLLQANYHALNHTITAKEMARSMGYAHFSAANLHYGKLAKLVGTKIPNLEMSTALVSVLVNFERPEKEWFWILRPALVRALENMGVIDDYHICEEVQFDSPLYEGKVKVVKVDKYERNSKARELCIAHYGCKCSICDLSLHEKYGESAQGLIVVHHLVSLAEIGQQYEVDPIKDLRPVCPNCHSVIHQKNPAYTVKEVREMIFKTNNRNQRK